MGWKLGVRIVTLISCLEASDKYALTDGDNRSEYFGDAGRSTSGLRELAPSSMLSPVLLCCSADSISIFVASNKLLRINMFNGNEADS